MLGRLSEIYGVTGHEGRVRAFLKAELAPYADEVITDPIGNLILHKKGKGPRVMLCAHMDEVGMLVKGVRDDGLLAIECRSIDPRVLISKRVVVGRDDVPGVIGAKAIHQQTKQEREKALQYEQIFVDIGAKDKADALKYVSPGDPVCFTTKFSDFGEGLFKGKALDDRVGCYNVARLFKNRYDCDLYAAFTVQEEAGLRGAGVAGRRVQPQVMLNFEGTTANDVPDSEGHTSVTSVGKGPALTMMDRTLIVPQRMLDALKKSAHKAGLPWQLRKGAAGGTDAGMVALAASGCVCGGISLPCRYIHSPCSVASWDDLENVYKLADGFLSSKKFNEVI